MQRIITLLMATQASATSTTSSDLPMREIISTHMAELSPAEWGKFMGGFSIGSIVEIGDIDHEDCLAQIEAAS